MDYSKFIVSNQMENPIVYKGGKEHNATTGKNRLHKYVSSKAYFLNSKELSCYA